ncbi:MAG TPA: protein kinase, partial [Urbifossiella sp.]|nr:protein kinase [Urbifossiella sp.]
MPTAVTCPNPDCARRSTVPDGVAGRSVRCPACGTRFPAGSGTTVGASGPATPSRTDLAAVGRFVVREKLGAGAFGTVYRAYDPHLDREVALKVPNPGVLDGPTRVERFLREAKAAANLRHPHVVPVYDAGRDGDRYFIASAFVDGKPLSEAVEDGGVDVNRAARLTRELAEALAYAHGEGIVHRDVKPANVMLDAADRVHLMDFGLASRADEASRLTTDGAVLGTPAYMAPENATGAAGDPQPAADQYACGVVLYELLTGRVPFEGPVHVVLHNQVHADPEPPSAGRRAVSKDLETICLKALAKRPERRYRDCQALADDLRRWQEGEPIAARRMGVVERARRWAQKEPKLAVAGAVVALVVLVSVAVVSGAARRAIRAAGEAEEARAGAEEARTGAVTEAARARTAEKQAADALAAEKVARARELKATGEVVAAKQRTEQEQGKVAAEQVKTEQERKNAEREKARTEAIRGAVRRAALGARITQTAHEEAVAGRAGLAESILDLVSPEDRSFEWWHATNVCRTGAASAPEFSRQPTGVRAASFNPAGTRVVTTGGEFTKSGEARVWDAKTGALLQTFNGHADIVLSAGFSPDGVWVV